MYEMKTNIIASDDHSSEALGISAAGGQGTMADSENIDVSEWRGDCFQ